MAAEGQAWPPRWLTPCPEEDIEAGDGDLAASWIEALCKVTMDSIAARAGEPMHLRDWQRDLLGVLLARNAHTGRLRHRVALVGVARKNGKSALLAALALFHLFMGPRGGQVFVVAGARDQARIIFDTAKAMIRMEPELAERCRVLRDAIEVPATGSVFRVMSSDAPLLEGLNPTFVAFDEVHVQGDRKLWDVLRLAGGARAETQMIGITTAGVRTDSQGRDTLCFDLYRYGVRVALGEVEDESFALAWWEPADPDADHRLESTWAEGNPGLGDIVGIEDFRSSVKMTPEPEFRTKRCNQWVSTSTSWLPFGAWAGCLGAPPDPGERVVLGFDGSYSGDCTAVIVVGVSRPNRVAVVKVWEPVDGVVPVLEVEQAIRDAAERWVVVEVAADPYRWARSLEVLKEDGLPVEPFPQSASRMVPATQRFYEAAVNQTIEHDGDPVLARHVDSCEIKVDERGSRLTKGSKRRRIDAAVAAVMALDRAVWWGNQSDVEIDPGVWLL